MPKELPKECPECGATAGWYVCGEHKISIRPDGEVSIGRKNNTRYGQQFTAQCNSRKCDAIVNVYLDAAVERTGEVESSGANALIDIMMEEDMPIVKQTCNRCNKEFFTELMVGQSREDGGVVLRTSAYCGCGSSAKERIQDSVIVTNVARITNPDEVVQHLNESYLTQPKT